MKQKVAFNSNQMSCSSNFTVCCFAGFNLLCNKTSPHRDKQSHNKKQRNFFHILCVKAVLKQKTPPDQALALCCEVVLLIVSYEYIMRSVTGGQTSGWF